MKLTPGGRARCAVAWGRNDVIDRYVSQRVTVINHCPQIALSRPYTDDLDGLPVLVERGWKLTHRATGYSISPIEFATQQEACDWLTRFNERYNVPWHRMLTVAAVRDFAEGAGMERWQRAAPMIHRSLAS